MTDTDLIDQRLAAGHAAGQSRAKLASCHVTNCLLHGQVTSYLMYVKAKRQSAYSNGQVTSYLQYE